MAAYDRIDVDVTPSVLRVPSRTIAVSTEERQWTAQWTAALNLPSDTHERAIHRLKTLREVCPALPMSACCPFFCSGVVVVLQLVADFTAAAIADVIDIVADPTLHSIGGAGGVAGGNKHLHNNIIYKFCSASSESASRRFYGSLEVSITCPSGT
jgi:hypothetical protein